ncbi:MAG: phosphate ABC transporter permease subunit PstC, partial [Silvanigrellaceae bacterium]|nr:phosphate ABC transporter permease subunit PstC [Silvanigrellaceae bacterium]
AFFICEIAPKKISKTMRIIIDLMAGIPSIIFGMWGLFVLAPFCADYIQTPLNILSQDIPIISAFFGGPAIGIGVFTASIILGIMIIPTISSTLIEVFYSAPLVLKDSAFALGTTKWEYAHKVLFPFVRYGIVGSITLGFGRALGETMAVTFVIGNSKTLSSSLFMPGTTISATIANEFNEATGHLYRSALIELGLILFSISFVVLGVSRFILLHLNSSKKSENKYG